MPASMPMDDDLACQRFYDARYASGYMEEWPARRVARVREIIADLGLPAKGTAVDFGCGNGVFAAVLRDSLPGWRIVGLDVSRIAIANARRTVLGCEFHHLDESDTRTPGESRGDWVGEADLLFTHHVLEHVRDLDRCWTRMAGLMKPRSWMLHVLPCGNPGSFEHRLCSLRADGIDAQAGGRFFYEDPAHLRRLQTGDMVRWAGRFGYRVARAYYGHHQVEAVDWLSGNGVRFVLDLCDPTKAVDAKAARELTKIRRRLLWMALVKRLARDRRMWMQPLAVPAKWMTNRWAQAANREWQQMRDDPAGSEMYLAFRRD
ncbi:MAG TPA: methyltransferase domain-containing protein [Phycisphaerae bacterium]|nr:methyltransferase domain-containing protein [Phycisphaerae bacterium]HOJ73759.1 methyltransferase domain-containing protein [Phycisphaerae bacterium]HOM50406.1 methyltransferase domain-containing protein [Phycisphaerae bacterium]HON65692.1 methyltransferase domain-containing protein [Phycisphaerae bacterium]HOQ84182.1 methyltransferase domain-containing protein [Phycisphaerae bacterium]